MDLYRAGKSSILDPFAITQHKTVPLTAHSTQFTAPRRVSLDKIQKIFSFTLINE